jgi:hypothetical protein
MLLTSMFTPAMLSPDATNMKSVSMNAPSARFIVLIVLLFMERVSKLHEQEVRMRARSRDVHRDASLQARSLAVDALASLCFPPPLVHALFTFMVLHPVPSVCLTLARLLMKMLPFVEMSMDMFAWVHQAYKSVDHALGVAHAAARSGHPRVSQLQKAILDLYHVSVRKMIHQREAARKKRSAERKKIERVEPVPDEPPVAPADSTALPSPPSATAPSSSTVPVTTTAATATSSTSASAAPAAVRDVAISLSPPISSLLTVMQVMRVLSSDLSPAQLAVPVDASSTVSMHGFLSNFIKSLSTGEIESALFTSAEMAHPKRSLKYWFDLFQTRTPPHACKLYTELATYLNAHLQKHLAVSERAQMELKSQIAFLKAIGVEMKQPTTDAVSIPLTKQGLLLDKIKELRESWNNMTDEEKAQDQTVEPLMGAFDTAFDHYPLLAKLGLHEFVMHALILLQFNSIVSEILYLFDLTVAPSSDRAAATVPATGGGGTLATSSSPSSPFAPTPSPYAALHTSVCFDLLFSCKSFLLMHVKQTWLTESLARTVQHSSGNLQLDTFRAQKVQPDQIGFNNVRKSLFGQMVKQAYTNAHIQCRTTTNNRAFNVAYIGLHASDAGGPYREALNDVVKELQSNRLPFFLPVPNAKAGTGSNRDCWVTRPFFVSPPPFSNVVLTPQMSRTYLLRKQCYRFIGMLLGLAIRSKYLLPLNLPPIIWRLLVHEEVTLKHVEEIDRLSFALIQDMTKQNQKIKERGGNGKADTPSAAASSSSSSSSSSFSIHVDAAPAAATSSSSSSSSLTDDTFLFDELMSELKFEVTGADGISYELMPNGRNIGLNSSNWQQYVYLLRRHRLHEFDAEVCEIRTGLTSVVPSAYLQLYSGSELRMLVVGTGTVDMELLERMTTVTSELQNTETIRWFWHALKNRFTPAQQAKFLTFVSVEMSSRTLDHTWVRWRCCVSCAYPPSCVSARLLMCCCSWCACCVFSL